MATLDLVKIPKFTWHTRLMFFNMFRRIKGGLYETKKEKTK